MKEKFKNPFITANGEDRAYIQAKELKTIWLNTGTLCNIECKNCYIESSPKNDRLVYLTTNEVESVLQEIANENMPVEEIGITGGEPFMNKDIMEIVESILIRGFRLIILTNAMKPMLRFKEELIAINKKFKGFMIIRVSIDHHTKELHEDERGENTFDKMLDGLKWLSDKNFTINLAGRMRWEENENSMRKGYEKFCNQHNIKINCYNKQQLILFPEMDEKQEVPEITTKCFDILNTNIDDVMCSNSRMVVKRKGNKNLSVIACTLLPYEEEFELGSNLKDSMQKVYLNHPHCAKFCILGGASCSG